MRSATIATAMFAGLALANPLPRRGTHVVYNVNTVVEVVTVTAGQAPPAQASPTQPPPAQFYQVPSSAPVVSQPEATTPAAPAAPAASPAAGGSGPPSGGYAEKALWHHNAHRANHTDTPPLVWDESLASIAQQIGQSCNYAHDTSTGGGGYGQNIAAGKAASEVGQVISDMFYNGECDLYPGYGGEPSTASFKSWGHFSQIVWKSTTAVGCATVDCSGRGLGGVGGNVPAHFTVCNYKSPGKHTPDGQRMNIGPNKSTGNYNGEYAKNVLPSKNLPTVTG